MKSAIIVNPSSGNGRTVKRWRDVRDEVRSRLGGLEEFVTSTITDATRFAKQIVAQDYELLIIAGGDGTINEVVNGLFSDENRIINDHLKVGVLSSGSGCDYIKSIGVPSDFRESVDLLINPRTQKVDVGMAFFKDEFGREKKKYFINSASAGLGGMVVHKISHVTKWLPASVAYFGAASTSFLKSKGQTMKVTVDDHVFFDGKCLNVFIQLGGYSGAGMHWAPSAKVNDGLFDVVLIGDLPKYRLLSSAHRLYDGTFINLPGVHSTTGSRVSVDSKDDVYLEVDGEQPGVAPAAYSILPQALNFVVGPSI